MHLKGLVLVGNKDMKCFDVRSASWRKNQAAPVGLY